MQLQEKVHSVGQIG